MSTVLVPSWNSLVGMVKVGAELAEGGISVRLQEMCNWDGHSGTLMYCSKGCHAGTLMYCSKGCYSGTLMYCSEGSHSGTLMYGSEGSRMLALDSNADHLPLTAAFPLT